MSQFSATDELPLDGLLWRFALAVYKSDSVADSCIFLQERFSADVNLLLFGAWMAAQRGVVMHEEDAMFARGLVDAWQADIVRPLRGVRQRLKTGPCPAPGKLSEILRNDIKGAELLGERIELAWLECHAGNCGKKSDMPLTDALWLNLKNILSPSAADGQADVATQHLGVIVKAVQDWMAQASKPAP
jgi:uncharacterized protein (TIGR02444 family)